MKPSRGYYDLFRKTCARFPSNFAVRQYENGSYKYYTYSELYGICEYLSQNLQKLQCIRGIIGVITERNFMVPCIIAAAHKFSSTFMFLDPAQNIDNVPNKIKFTVVITVSKEMNAFSHLFDKRADRTITIFDMFLNFFVIDTTLKHDNEHSFIAKTSGSTGEPKLVQVPMQCIQPNIDDLATLFDITVDDIIFFTTPLTFDPSMVEILLACKNGASLLIAPNKAEILFPDNNENSVTFWQTTPSNFLQFSNADIKNKILDQNSKLKILALGGEPLNSVIRLKELKDKNNKTRIFTLYGVTEMSCWACVAELDLNKIITDSEIPLGKCLSETEVVLEPRKEIESSSNIVLVSKTRKCIILNNPSSQEGQNSLIFIKTGDLGEEKNGNIYYRGRKDDIIKRFGHKVNLQLIESTIMHCPKVKSCSCVWLPKPMLLVVYYSSETLNSKGLSAFLKSKIDEKHWPDKIIRVDNLPTNSHGKISKEILAKMFQKNSISLDTPDALRISFLKNMKETISENLTYDEIKDKDFFSIGGTSFLAIAICNKFSSISPDLGKAILPYLISRRYTIEQIMQLTEKDLRKEEKNPRKCFKRSRSNTASHSNSTNFSFKKVGMNPTNASRFAILWTYNTGKCVDASPILYQTGQNILVAVGSHSGKVIIANALSGILIGIITVNSRIEATVQCFNSLISNIPFGVVGAYDGSIVCFNMENGKEIWRLNINSMVKSKGVICNGFLYIASYDGNIKCIDVTTGVIKQTIHVADQAISADLVLAKNEYILLGTLSGVCAGIYGRTNTVAWRGNLDSPVFASPVLYDCDRYVVFAEVNGEIHCRTVEKGIKIWTYQGTKGNIFSSLYIREIGKLKWQITFGCHDCNVYSILIKNFQPSLYWKCLLTSAVYSTPCKLRDNMILAASNNGKLCVIDAETGSLVTEYHLPGETFSSPVVYQDLIFIGCRDDNLYSIKCDIN